MAFHRIRGQQTRRRLVDLLGAMAEEAR